MGWVESGQAWGERAADWAYLMEPYARRANDALFDRAGVGPGTRLLDIACGSGYAASVAAGRGAEVAGLDASEALIAIARARTPGGDFRVGDMFALPFDDDRFDVATSFNGIWKGCEDALAEARRVVRPGGLVGFSFWGSPKRLGLLPFFATLLELSPPGHVDATLNQGDTGRPGVAEQMLADAGLEFVGPGNRAGRQRVARPRPGGPGARLRRAVLAGPAGGWLRPVRRGDPRGNPPAVHRRSRRPDRLRVRLDHRTGPQRLRSAQNHLICTAHPLNRSLAPRVH